MDFFDFLTMVGGLALFLYGMDVMGDGLAKTSGGKLEQILEKLTSTLSVFPLCLEAATDDPHPPAHCHHHMIPYIHAGNRQK